MSKNFLKLSLGVTVLALFFCLGNNFALSATTIPSLDVGSRGSSIKMFQTTLNLDPSTTLTTVGDGAPGRETDYFGSKTRLAVLKFQKKYRIIGENGKIGPKTRQIMNNIGPKMALAKKNKKPLIPTDWPESVDDTANAGVTKTYSPTPAVKKVTPVVKKTVVKTVKAKLSSVSPSIVMNGGTVTVLGEGFTKTGNSIVTRYKTYNNVSSNDGRTLSFTFSIPVGEITASGIRQLPSGVVSSISVPISLKVTNRNGTSNELVFNCQI